MGRDRMGKVKIISNNQRDHLPLSLYCNIIQRHVMYITVLKTPESQGIFNVHKLNTFLSSKVKVFNKEKFKNIVIC